MLLCMGHRASIKRRKRERYYVSLFESHEETQLRISRETNAET